MVEVWGEMLTVRTGARGPLALRTHLTPIVDEEYGIFLQELTGSSSSYSILYIYRCISVRDVNICNELSRSSKGDGPPPRFWP